MRYAAIDACSRVRTPSKPPGGWWIRSPVRQRLYMTMSRTHGARLRRIGSVRPKAGRSQPAALLDDGWFSMRPGVRGVQRGNDQGDFERHRGTPRREAVTNPLM